MFLVALLCAGWAMSPPGGVVVEGQLQSPPAPGTSTPFTISITKGGLEYFGRILISMPDDCRLNAKQLHGGNLTWNEERNVVVISWLKLPSTDRFDVLLDLEVAPTAEPGPRTLEWDFSFIRNNDRVSLRPPPFLFEVQGAAAMTRTEQSTPLDNSAEADTAPLSTGRAKAIRNMRRLNDGALEITITLDGVPSGGFVRLEESIGAACPIEVKRASGGVTEITPDGLSVIWFDFQDAGDIVYHIDHCDLSDPEEFSGVLSFVNNDEPANILVIQGGAWNPTVSIPDQISHDNDGIRFEVQIAATKNEVVTDYFNQRLDFGLPIRKEEDGNWFKYLNGSFAEYQNARNHRVAVSSAYAFRGPFVVARRNGQRIPVQEALTRTGQSWIP